VDLVAHVLDDPVRRARLRLLLVAAVCVALAAGVALHAYGHTGDRPVPWRDVSAEAHGLDRSVAVFRVTKRGDRERVLVSPGPRSSTGYGVQVVSVTEQRKRILLQVRETSPRLGQRVQARVTYPYVLIEIPRTRKHVAVDWLGH
jgi:hypothetical protein